MDEQQTNTQQTQISPPADDKQAKPATQQETRQELKEAIKGSNEVLVSARTVFMLFPDTVVLDRAKLTVTKRTFVSSAEVMSIRIEDVLNVTATVGPLLGSLKITSRIINSGPFRIGKFWRQDAERLKHITQGYVIALQRGIEVSTMGTTELIPMLEKLGRDDHSTQI